LKADAERLTQILLNFLGNAVKFTHEGSITVSASVKSLLSQETELFVSIKDTGIGLTMEEKKKNYLKDFHKLNQQYHVNMEAQD